MRSRASDSRLWIGPPWPRRDLATAVRICPGLSFLSREDRDRLREDLEANGMAADEFAVKIDHLILRLNLEFAASEGRDLFHGQVFSSPQGGEVPPGRLEVDVAEDHDVEEAVPVSACGAGMRPAPK